jgi:hypothetical protein
LSALARRGRANTEEFTVPGDADNISQKIEKGAWVFALDFQGTQSKIITRGLVVGPRQRRKKNRKTEWIVRFRDPDNSALSDWYLGPDMLWLTWEEAQQSIRSAAMDSEDTIFISNYWDRLGQGLQIEIDWARFQDVIDTDKDAFVMIEAKAVQVPMDRSATSLQSLKPKSRLNQHVLNYYSGLINERYNSTRDAGEDHVLCWCLSSFFLTRERCIETGANDIEDLTGGTKRKRQSPRPRPAQLTKKLGEELLGKHGDLEKIIESKAKLRAVMAPVCTGVHWYLAILDFLQRTFLVFDSRPSRSDRPTPTKEATKADMQALRDALVGSNVSLVKPQQDVEWKFASLDGPQQSDEGNDCGVFVAQSMRLCASTVHFNSNAEFDLFSGHMEANIDSLRKRMFVEICKGKVQNGEALLGEEEMDQSTSPASSSSSSSSSSVCASTMELAKNAMIRCSSCDTTFDLKKGGRLCLVRLPDSKLGPGNHDTHGVCGDCAPNLCCVCGLADPTKKCDRCNRRVHSTISGCATVKPVDSAAPDEWVCRICSDT